MVNTSSLIRPILQVCGWNWLISKILNRADEGHVDLAEARCLSLLAMRAPDSRPIIEIGTLFGVSTRVLFCAKPRPTPLISVDNYSWNPLLLSRAAHRRQTTRRWTQLQVDYQVELRDMEREEFYAGYEGPAPFLVFLDAIHTYEATRTDLQWALKVKSDIICSHDYRSEWPGVVRAVDEVGPVSLLVDHLAIQGFTPLGQTVIESVRGKL